ncbi:MAG: hypothetical protein ACKOYJ_01800 [Planctomycetia bacterium]
MFDVIERLKSEWTDKHVVIDSPAPELARFAKTTGQVKTVNMNGRCLVEFDQYNNIGWYDIDPSALKIVPKPLPKPPEAKPAKAAAPAKPAPAKPTAAKPAAGKPSTADILAAARGKGGGAAAAKPAGSRPSTAEILAAARGASAAPAAKAPAPAPAVEEAASEEPAAAPAPVVKAKAAKPAAGPLPTTTSEKIAWCRANDAKG